MEYEDVVMAVGVAGSGFIKWQSVVEFVLHIHSFYSKLKGLR